MLPSDNAMRTRGSGRAGPTAPGGYASAVRSPAAEVYGRRFWLIYASNALTMTAISMLVRYADFVSFLGGGEGQLGLIVGAGMSGSLAVRMAQGVGIDRYGSRRIWLSSLALLAISLLAHRWITTAAGTGIFGVRIAMQTAIAGVFGASITYISRRASPERIAEIVGTMGTSGFLGVLAGPQLSDWICGRAHIGRSQLDQLFAASALIVALAWLFAWLATGGESFPTRRRRPSSFALLRRYHPGIILLVAVAAGAGLNLPYTFLRTFAVEHGIPAIGAFFSVYAIAALAVRLLTRNLFARYGNRPWVLCGLAALILSLSLYPLVHQPWQLGFPGALAGVAQALLFPAVVASGSTAFPERYRGLGTTLLLAMFDLGNLIGSPLIGGILHFARQHGLAAYPTMLFSVAAVLVLVGGVFALGDRGSRKRVRARGPGRRSEQDSAHRPKLDLRPSSPAPKSTSAQPAAAHRLAKER